MRVLGLCGRTGTGKSHNAMWIARENKIDYIIDDGLLIGKNKIIAGKSAKRERTKIASIECALFLDQVLADNMKNAITENEIKNIMIIGTSEKMIKSIASALSLSEFEQVIFIEDVISKEEIEIALKVRNTMGKHVIPVPTFEVKKHFSGYFLMPIKLIFKFIHGKDLFAEKTIIRPTYSYRGQYTISDSAIADICAFSAKKAGAHKVIKTDIINLPNGEIDLTVDMVLKYPCKINEVGENVFSAIQESVETFAGININHLIINIRNLVVSATVVR